MQALAESAGIELELRSVSLELGVGKICGFLIAEEPIMVFPESPLFPRAFGPVGGSERWLSENGEMAVDEADLALVDVVFFELGQGFGPKLPAKAALEVGELDNLDGRIRPAQGWSFSQRRENISDRYILRS